MEPSNQANAGAYRVNNPMANNTISSNANKDLCEAYGCFSRATSTCVVKVGERGTVSLNLCNVCVKKFQEDILQ